MIKNGKTIYKSHDENKSSNLPGFNHNPEKNRLLNKQISNLELEKLVDEMSESIKTLKELQLNFSSEVEIMKNNNAFLSMSYKNFNKLTTRKILEKYRHKHKEDYDIQENIRLENESLLHKIRILKNLKILDILAWSTSGLFVVWYANLVNLINIDPFQNIIFGSSVALAISLGVVHKLEKN